MMNKIKQGELSSANESKLMREKLAIDPNAKVKHGSMSGDSNDKKGKSKSKVDPSIFKMAEERDY